LPKIKGKKEIEGFNNIKKIKGMFINIERNILEKNIIKDMIIVKKDIKDMMVIGILIEEKDITDQNIMLVIGTHGINGRDTIDIIGMIIGMVVTTDRMEVFILNLKQMMVDSHFR
jgi:hypothetical protein